MSFWNYRIVKISEERGPEGQGSDWYGLFEVFYEDNGEPVARTEDPIDFAGYETAEELITALETALEDAKKQPALDDLKEWVDDAEERQGK